MIKSKRIYLEPLTEKDFEFYKEIYSDSSLMKYVNGALDEEALKNSFDITLRKMSNLNDNSLIVLVIRKNNNNSKIGLTSLNWNQSQINDAEIGTIISRKHQRRNYAEEAMYLLMSYGFKSLKVKNIYGYCNPDNGVNFLTKKMSFKKIGLCTYKGTKAIKWEINSERISNYKKQFK
jgi:RimJ/RimL family protein N-acetyltransferase